MGRATFSAIFFTNSSGHPERVANTLVQHCDRRQSGHVQQRVLVEHRETNLIVERIVFACQRESNESREARSKSRARPSQGLFWCLFWCLFASADDCKQSAAVKSTFLFHSNQGCQMLLGTTYQNGKIYIYQITINIPNGHKIYQMATRYTKWPQDIPNGHKIPIPQSAFASPSKIYPN
jgi:hypothetical protein